MTNLVLEQEKVSRYVFQANTPRNATNLQCFKYYNLVKSMYYYIEQLNVYNSVNM